MLMGINIKEKATTLREDLRLYWKKPPMGRYMSFKEIVSLAVGGLGIQFVVFCAQNMIISIGNTLISNTIGIAPKPLYIIYILSVILSFPLTALRGKIRLVEEQKRTLSTVYSFNGSADGASCNRLCLYAV